MVGKLGLRWLLDRGNKLALTPTQGGFNGVCQTLAEVSLEDEAVNHRFNMVAALFIYLDLILATEVGDRSVDTSADKSFASEFVDDIAEFPGLTADEGGEKDDFASLGEG